MRTSHTQYVTMVEFMEENGDLSKLGGPRDRHATQLKWKELTGKLNRDRSGDPRQIDRWRKVWSDYKNNVKRKKARINTAAQDTDGGPTQLTLTDLESRVMQIIGVQSTTKRAKAEPEYEQDQDELEYEQPVKSEVKLSPRVDSDASHDFHMSDEMQSDLSECTSIAATTEYWNTPGTSDQPTIANSESQWQPLRKKKKTNQNTLLLKIRNDSKKKARQNENDRIGLLLELERERVRQRDVELQLQAQWLEIMKECMKVLHKFVDDRNK